MSLDKLEDRRSKCWSVMITIPMQEYSDIVQPIYQDNGGIEGQRAPLRTKTALAIRKRMIDDMIHGAVLPPVVIGIHTTSEVLNSLIQATTTSEFVDIVRSLDHSSVSIIDGVQRTTAMFDAIGLNADIRKTPIRVEFWISTILNSLIYRMLILNTGQVPWDISRQLETVYRQLLQQLQAQLADDANIFLKDAKRRRTAATQYQSKDVLELFLLFSSRRSEIDVRDKVAEDFARLDVIETTSQEGFLDLFVTTMRLIAALDKQFTRYRHNENMLSRKRFVDGHDIFSSFPAMVGFATAMSTSLFDEPGFPIRWDEVPEKISKIEADVDLMLNKLKRLDDSQLGEYLQLDLLEERLSGRSGQVGRFERDFFKRAFYVLLRNTNRLEDMTPCWSV